MGGNAHVAAGALDCPNLGWFHIDPELDLSTDATLGTAMLAGVPFALALDLGPGAVDQQVQRTLRTPLRVAVDLGATSAHAVLGCAGGYRRPDCDL